MVSTETPRSPATSRRRWRLGRRWRSVLVLPALLAAVVALPTDSASAGPGRSTAAKPTIVLVHGAWADASSFTPVTRRLQRDGYTVLVPANPLRGLASDAAYIASYVNQRTSGPVVLVGHSYGGAVVTNAALAAPRVRSLVYIDAFAPEAGESLQSILQDFGAAPDPSSVFDIVGFPGAAAGDADIYFKPAVFPVAFGNGLSARENAVLAASQKPLSLHAFGEKSGPPAWKTLPSWYVVGTADRVVPPPLQLQMANRAHSTVSMVDAGHLSMLVRPGFVEHVIERAASAP
jgi:pimeloyl-ACP methyl ester carboxylesterase